MKILYIGEPQTHNLYLRGATPSHWFYGAEEMSRDGHQVIWEEEKPGLWYDLKYIVRHKPDIVFIPNLNISNHLLLLILSSIGLVSPSVFAWLHRGYKNVHGVKRRLIRQCLRGVRHIFFLSCKSMDEAVENFGIESNRCSVPGWGPDMDFYNRIKTSDNGWFVSTGKENRDFETLIEAFKITGEPLLIMTARSHGTRTYDWLSDRCKDVANIRVELMPDSSDNYPRLLEAMASAKALVCPLIKDSLDYCVGLSTIADAEGLEKPLIITENPYHDAERMRGFRQVSDIDDWVKAIEDVANDKGKPLSDNRASMDKVYQHIKSIMKL